MTNQLRSEHSERECNYGDASVWDKSFRDLHLNKSNRTSELTRRRESKHPSPHQASCERRSRRSRPTICYADARVFKFPPRVFPFRSVRTRLIRADLPRTRAPVHHAFTVPVSGTGDSSFICWIKDSLPFRPSP